MRVIAVAAVLMMGCSTPLAQLKVELGRRASDALGCPEARLEYEELDRLISSTRVKVSGCGREGTWKLVESRWTIASDKPPTR